MINEGRGRMKGIRGQNREINKRKKKSGKCKKRESEREIKGKKESSKENNKMKRERREESKNIKRGMSRKIN